MVGRILGQRLGCEAGVDLVCPVEGPAARHEGHGRSLPSTQEPVMGLLGGAPEELAGKAVMVEPLALAVPAPPDLPESAHEPATGAWPSALRLALG